MEILSEFPSLRTDSQFIFVPGPNDAWCGNILPRPKIPKFFSGSLIESLENAIFTSNPARIKYCSKEIVIFRDDLQNTMRRNCIIPPLETEDKLVEEQVSCVDLILFLAGLHIIGSGTFDTSTISSATRLLGT